jgi:hypothetical protein
MGIEEKMKKFISIIISLTILITPIIGLAHSGRTDAYGGHHDYNNASGLGSYHYHHGMGPHLHPGGICPYSVKSYSYSNSKLTVMSAQKALNKHGYNCGSVDGIIGSKTKAALKAFQRDHHLIIDGILGPQTKKTLGILT